MRRLAQTQFPATDQEYGPRAKIALHNSFRLAIEKIRAKLCHIDRVMTGTSMDMMDVLFWAAVMWAPSLLLTAFLLIPRRRRQVD